MPIVRNPARRPRVPRSPRSRSGLGLASLVAVFALLLAACSGTATPAPSAGPNGVTLVSGAAVSASVGSDGGELTASDPERGRSYRLTVPAGAFPEETEITATPIASIEGFPLDGGLLGGVELSPEGAVFLVPVTLEISLDADQQAELRTALDDGQAVVGFSYPGGTTNAASDLAVTLADVADDLSSVTLTLFGFSGHGAGTGSPQNLANRPCPPDPAKAAQCQINRILHPPGGPADPTDPAVRGQITNVLRDWLDVLEVVLDDSTDDPGDYRTALAEAIDWHRIAGQYDFVSDLWYAVGDELAFEGARLEDAVFRSYTAGLDQANRDCILDQTLDELLEWIDIHEIASILSGTPLPSYSALGALGPSTFCLELQLVAESSNPTELAEGAQGEFRFRIRDAIGALATDTQLDKLMAEVTATPADPSLLTASGDRLSLIAYADVTALRAIPGNSAEGRFEIKISLFGNTAAYATETVTFDIVPPPATPAPTITTITCSGSPTTVTARHGEVPDDQVTDHIYVHFSEGPACAIDAFVGGGDVILVVDTDANNALWDADSTGSWWMEGTGYGKDLATGSRTVTAVSAYTGQTYRVTLTVQISLIAGGPSTTMTVRDVTIAPA